MFITRDKKIRTRPGERSKLLEARVRAVVLTGTKNMTQDDAFHLIINYWGDLAEVNSRSGPYVFSLTTRGLRELAL